MCGGSGVFHANQTSLCLDPYFSLGSSWHREIGLSPPVKYLTDRFKAALLLWIICVFMSCVCHAFASVYYCLVVTCWEKADLLALVYDVYFHFCHFPTLYPRSIVVLGCINSRSLSPFLLLFCVCL